MYYVTCDTMSRASSPICTLLTSPIPRRATAVIATNVKDPSNLVKDASEYSIFIVKYLELFFS